MLDYADVLLLFFSVLRRCGATAGRWMRCLRLLVVRDLPPVAL